MPWFIMPGHIYKASNIKIMDKKETALLKSVSQRLKAENKKPPYEQMITTFQSGFHWFLLTNSPKSIVTRSIHYLYIDR